MRQAATTPPHKRTASERSQNDSLMFVRRGGGRSEWRCLRAAGRQDKSHGDMATAGDGERARRLRAAGTRSRRQGDCRNRSRKLSRTKWVSSSIGIRMPEIAGDRLNNSVSYEAVESNEESLHVAKDRWFRSVGLSRLGKAHRKFPRCGEIARLYRRNRTFEPLESPNDARPASRSPVF